MISKKKFANTNIHHINPKSRCFYRKEIYADENEKKIDIKYHKIWHQVFSNLNVAETITFLFLLENLNLKQKKINQINSCLFYLFGEMNFDQIFIFILFIMYGKKDCFRYVELADLKFDICQNNLVKAKKSAMYFRSQGWIEGIVRGLVKNSYHPFSFWLYETNKIFAKQFDDFLNHELLKIDFSSKMLN